MEVKFKKLIPEASTPKQGSAAAAGFDLVATSCNFNENTLTWDYGTGIAVEIPSGFAGFLFPRSSVCKTGLSLCNSVGVIDSDYRGEVMLKFYTEIDEEDSRPYHIGDRIGQLVILPVPQITFAEVSALDETARGEGGFGSTGK